MTQTRRYAPGAVFAAGVCAAAAFAATPALANGGDFFEEFAAQFLAQNTEIGPSYFGFIRDGRGRVIRDASVSATITTSGSGMVVKSDILGHYEIPGFAKQIDPETVEISCSKPGYHQVTATRRIQRRDENTPIEINCTLAPLTAESS